MTGQGGGRPPASTTEKKDFYPSSNSTMVPRCLVDEMPETSLGNIVWLPQPVRAHSLWVNMAVVRVKIFTEANMLITYPLRYVSCSLRRPNILPLFNLSWWFQHSVAALLFFLKQPHNNIWFELALQKCFVAILQKNHRGKCLICLNVATAQVKQRCSFQWLADGEIAVRTWRVTFKSRRVETSGA